MKYFLLLLIYLLNVAPSNAADINENDWSLFRDPSFTFKFPKTWEIRAPMMGQKALVKSKQDASNCNFRSMYEEKLENVHSTYLVEVYSQNDPSVAAVRQIANEVKIIRAEQGQVSGEHAWISDLEYRAKAGSFRTITTSFLHDGTLYTIGCTDTAEHFAESLPKFEKIISSFSAIK
jgi:uncharacterized protein YbcV (DUF1398 family)